MDGVGDANKIGNNKNNSSRLWSFHSVLLEILEISHLSLTTTTCGTSYSCAHPTDKETETWGVCHMPNTLGNRYTRTGTPVGHQHRLGVHLSAAASPADGSPPLAACGPQHYRLVVARRPQGRGAGRGEAMRGPGSQQQNTTSWRRFFPLYPLPAFPMSPVREKVSPGTATPSYPRHLLFEPKKGHRLASPTAEVSNTAPFSLC